jgi:hypothetical protein
LQGYVLDGFPKTPTQLEYLKDLKINPSLFITLNTNHELSLERK